MKFRTTADIDLFIDTRLFAFPYIDDVKQILEPGELDDINEYASVLKEKLKYINNNLSKQERENHNFYPMHIKEIFDSIMFRYYEKQFFRGLEKLLCQYGGYARELIEDFYFKKEYDAGYIVSRAKFYLDELMELDRLAEINHESKSNSKR